MTQLGKRNKETLSKDKKKSEHYVKIVEDNDSSSSEAEDDNEYVFSTNQTFLEGQILINIGGVDVNMIIDSGVSVNVIESLKVLNIKCTSSLKKRELYAYGSTKPLTVTGTFTTDIVFESQNVKKNYLS